MYTSVPNIERKLGKQLTDQQLSYFNEVLSPGIDAYINRVTETKFGGTEPEDVYVEDLLSGTVVIPTMHDITAVAYVGPDGTETAIPDTEYFTYPRGDGNKYALKRWYGLWTDIYPWRRNYYSDHRYREEYGAYKITGVLGHKEIPDDIVSVATELAINDLNANLNNYKRESVGDWDVWYNEAVKLSPMSESMLSAYRRLSRSML